MEILLLYYGIFCIVIVLAFLVVRTQGSSGGPGWRLTPELALVASYFCYTSAMPVSRVVWGTTLEDLDIGFLQIHILGGLGLLCGLFFGKRFAPERAGARRSIPMTPLSPVRCVIFASGALLVVAGLIYYSVGLDFSNLFTPYGFEASISRGDNIITPAAIATLVCCYNGALAHAPRQTRLRRLVLVLAFIVTAAFLVRGSRNVTLIIWTPIAALALAGRRLPILKTAVIAISAFLVYSVVAVTRSVGLAEANSLPVTLDRLDPLQGELSTSYNVYRIYNLISFQDDLRYGKTYVVDFALNLVPRALWPNRPDSTAVGFSANYFQTEDLVEGLGFSPVVEAMINFSALGVFPVFALFGAAVVVVARYLRNKGRWGILSYSMMLPMMVNWNRIDSSAFGKMFLVYIFLFIILDRLMYIRGLSSRPLHYAPAALAGGLEFQSSGRRQ